MGKYFSTTLKPVLPVATQIGSGTTDLAFGPGDVMWDWHAFDVPKGANRLISCTIIVRGEDGAPQTVRDLQLIFAKSDADGTAPTSLGTGNATVDGYGYYNNLLAHKIIDITEHAVHLDYIGMATGGGAGQSGLIPGQHIILQGEPDSGTNVGYDKLYIGGIGGASNAWDFSTGVLANAAVSDGAASTFVVKTVDPRKVFAPGDVIHVHDSDTAIGTVKSLTDNDIILTAANGVAIAEDDEIMLASPVTVILGFER